LRRRERAGGRHAVHAGIGDLLPLPCRRPGRKAVRRRRRCFWRVRRLRRSASCRGWRQPGRGRGHCRRLAALPPLQRRRGVPVALRWRLLHRHLRESLRLRDLRRRVRPSDGTLRCAGRYAAPPTARPFGVPPSLCGFAPAVDNWASPCARAGAHSTSSCRTTATALPSSTATATWVCPPRACVHCRGLCATAALAASIAQMRESCSSTGPYA
jgi:hypothetical protein